MPIYEYRCDQGHTFEVKQRMADGPVETCLTCERPVQRVFHPVAVHFKGSGFYNTDYGKRKRGSGEGEGEGESKPAGAGDSKKSGDGGAGDSKGSSSEGKGTGDSKGASDSGSKRSSAAPSSP